MVCLCLICYKITQIFPAEFQKASWGNHKNRAESSEAQTARTISDWTLLLLLERSFSASGRLQDELVLASDSEVTRRAQGDTPHSGSEDGSL